jgi:hypothetical protein
MPVELLTYAALGERLNCFPEAARSLAKRLRLPRQLANDGKALVVVDVAELSHKPMPARSPAGDHPITATLKARRSWPRSKHRQWVTGRTSSMSASGPIGSYGAVAGDGRYPCSVVRRMPGL